jgi:hypothetical protein
MNKQHHVVPYFSGHTLSLPLNKLRPHLVGRLLAVSLLCGSLGMAVPAQAQLSIGFSFPSFNVGIDLPAYPQLVLIPGSPVYYAPRLSLNFFFFDGLYWVYRDDNWYSSNWYNGPWRSVEPAYVPLFVLRVPVRYYRQAPDYFRGWRADAPPRWGQRWGRDWEQQHSGWDKWDRRSVPAAAPLPSYQRQYRGDAYPHAVEQQHAIHNDNYRYQPRDAVTREQYRAPAAQPAPREEPGRDAGPPASHQQQGSDPSRQQREAQNPQRPPPDAPQSHAREQGPPAQQRQEAPPDNRGRDNPGQGNPHDDNRNPGGKGGEQGHDRH